MQQALSRRHGQQCGGLRAATGLPEDHDVAGIVAEARDVVPDPPQCGDRVEHPVHPRGRPLLGRAEVGEVEVAEHAEPVVDRDHHDVAEPGQRVPVEPAVVAGAGAEPAAVEGDEHRPAPAVRSRRPHVEHQAVLVLAAGLVEPADQHRVVVAGAGRRLGRHVPETGGVPYTAPQRRRGRWPEPVGAAGRATVRDAEEGADPVGAAAAHPAGRRLDQVGAPRRGRGRRCAHGGAEAEEGGRREQSAAAEYRSGSPWRVSD